MESASPEASSAPPSTPPPPPPAPHRLTRSTRDRMWAGVAGGLAEYLDLDPALVRLIWVLAAVLTHGLAIPIYIVAWIVMPRDDRPRAESESESVNAMHDSSHELHTEANRLADEARRICEIVSPAHSSPSDA